MVGHGTKFGRKKEAAIVALLSQRTVEEAARSLEIGVNTLLRWMKDPEFDAEYRQAKCSVFGQAIARLQQGTSARRMRLKWKRSRHGWRFSSRLPPRPSATRGDISTR